MVLHPVHQSVGEKHESGGQRGFEPATGWPLMGVLLNSILVVNEVFEERMLGPSEDEVVIGPDWPRPGRQCQEREVKKLVQRLFAFQTQIEVNATIVVEDEVPQDVGALCRLVVGSVSFVEMGILGADPFSGDVICPEPVLPTFLAFVKSDACAVWLFVLVGWTVAILLKEDVVQDLWHQRAVDVFRRDVSIVFRRNVEVASVEVPVGAECLEWFTEQWPEFILHEIRVDGECHEDYNSDYPSYDVHCLGLEWIFLFWRATESRSSLEVRTWLGMPSEGRRALGSDVCIDVEATMC